MKLKICGITRLHDAMDAVEAGASAVGFIFARSSPRYISPAGAGAIVRRLPSHVSTVGVVVNLPRTEIMSVIAESSIAVLQFHGTEQPEELVGYRVPVYKAFRVGDHFDGSRVKQYPGDTFLLDTAVPGVPGGTGVSFDWTIAHAASAFGRLILAGGITEQNVARAVIDVRPWAIDISSGVERSPGIKDKDKIVRLCAKIVASGGMIDQSPMF
jgi:phosphoribosylanthranilate isomerase